MATKTKTPSVEGGFAGIPRRVMDHPDWIALGANAKVLLLVLAYQYRARNNGDLSAAFTLAKRHGFRSKETLSRALDELLARRLIERSREGRFINPGGVCALYALTWERVDPCEGKQLTLAPTNKPLRDFGRELIDLKNKTPGPENGPGSPR